MGAAGQMGKLRSVCILGAHSLLSCPVHTSHLGAACMGSAGCFSPTHTHQHHNKFGIFPGAVTQGCWPRAGFVHRFSCRHTELSATGTGLAQARERDLLQKSVVHFEVSSSQTLSS